MADINQKISLKFETDLSQAKDDVTKLGELYEQSTKPTAEQGALSAEQKSALESEITQRATDVGLSPDAVKQTLADINVLKEQARSIDQQNIELDGQKTSLLEKQKQAKEEENQALSRAAVLLGLNADASKAEIEIAKEKLRTSKDLNISEKERKEKLAAVNKEYATARGAVTRQGNAAQKLLDITNKQNENANKQGTIIDQVRKGYLRLTKTIEERDTVEGKVTGEIINQRVELDKTARAAASLTKETQKNAKAQEDYTKSIKATPDSFGGKITSAFLYFQALNAVKRVAREAVRTITELDKALTDIAVVTTMSRKETWNLLGTYQEMAKQVGLTTTEVANLSIAFFRQGRSAVDALRLTQTAAQFAKIAAIDVQDAANFLTAAINGFNLSASDATSIIDKFAALGAGAAASAQEIAIALSKVAPAAASAGVEIDNLMAFVTKGIETTREAPENIGTAFKTIFARMRELTDIGKTFEDGMDVNRVESSLRSVGVALRDANGEFRDLDDVLIEVGKKWDSTDRNQQAYLATTLAGARQQTRLIALFDNFDRTLELIALSQESAGVAAIQHAEYMNGLEAANTRLRTSFQQLITSFVNSEMIIGFINLLNDVLELANTGLGKLVVTAGLLTLGITALSKVKAINTAITAIQAAAEENYLRALGKTGNMTGAAAKGTGVLTIAKMKLIAVTKALGAAIMGIPVVGWIIAAVAAVVALAVAFQKVRNSTDTTNIKIARLKVTFDRIAESVKKFGETMMAVFDNPAVKKALRAFLGVATLGTSEIVRGMIAIGKSIGSKELDSVGEAAASFRVLSNELKENNGRVFTLTKTTSQLNSEIQEFVRLDSIAFKTPAELKQRTEAQNVLKDSIRSTLDTMLEAGDIDQAEFSQEMALLDSSNTAESITALANKILKRQTDELERIQKESRTKVLDFMETFEGSFAEAAKSAEFKDLVGFLPAVAQEVAAAEAEVAKLTFSPVERDAINRAIALDPTAYLDGIETAKEATNEFYLKTIPAMERGIQLALSSTGDDFVNAVRSLQDIDFDSLSDSQKVLISNLLPNFEALRTLTASQLTRVGQAGGVAFIRSFQGVADSIGDLGLTDILLSSGEVDVTAAEQADTLTDFIFNALAVSAENKAAATRTLLAEIFSGVVSGIVLTPEQQNALAISVVNALGAVDVDAIGRRVDTFRSDMDKIEEIITKPIDKFTTQDKELLAQYPEIFDKLLQGSLDLNAEREKGVALIEQEIAEAEEQLNIAVDLKIEQFEKGIITREELESSVLLLRTNMNRLALDRQMLRTAKINVEAIKEKYKIELDSLTAQKKAMDDAKRMRDLQKESADIARQSIEATRTGALGTIEAQFNRQQLNTQIAEANKVLQDNIMTAQLEAQQKILEDSQQKAIEAATVANTQATILNTEAQTASAAASVRVADAIAASAGLTVSNPAVNIPSATINRNITPGYSLIDQTLSIVE